MLVVNVKKSGGIEKALKELKRKFSKTKQLKELRERKEFKKPSVQRRDTLKKAKYIQKLRTQENSDK
jgi:small subunit ribosomal protein S21